MANNNPGYRSYEKLDIVWIYYQVGSNANQAKDLYFERYPERRQPSRKIFGRLKENLENFGSLEKPRPKSYRKENAENDEISVLAKVEESNNYPPLREIEESFGIRSKGSKDCLLKSNP